MLETIAVVLAVLWLLGLVSSHTMGGFVHILLVLAIVVILVRVIQGRRALNGSRGDEVTGVKSAGVALTVAGILRLAYGGFVSCGSGPTSASRERSAA